MSDTDSDRPSLARNTNKINGGFQQVNAESCTNLHESAEQSHTKLAQNVHDAFRYLATFSRLVLIAALFGIAIIGWHRGFTAANIGLGAGAGALFVMLAICVMANLFFAGEDE